LCDGARVTAGAHRLRAEVQAFVRGFGLLSERETPCGQPVPAREAHCLMVLLEHDRRQQPVQQKQLQEELGIDKSNVTRLIQRLRDARRVEQVPFQGDGRARVLRLSARGRRLAETIERSSRERFGSLFASIPPERRALVIEALEVLNQALGRELGAAVEKETLAHA
jgi:DNA-binding MarR family transcriptional regulator